MVGSARTTDEGISGWEQYRGDLSLMYLARCEGSGALSELTLVPYHTRRFRLQRATSADTDWLQATLDRESARLGTYVIRKNGQLVAALR